MYMQNKMFLASISVALYNKALIAAESGQTCNVIMLCTASMEAFINEYIELGDRLIKQKQQHDAEEQEKRKSPFNNQYSNFISALYPIEIELLNMLKLNEEERKNIFHKINTIKKHCTNNELRKDKKIYCDYYTLVRLRNSLMHPRSKMVAWGNIHIPNFLLQFDQQKDIAYLNKIESNQPWIEAIETINFSKWCINAFQRMMISLLNDMFSLHIKDYRDIELLTNKNALFYTKSFNFPCDLIKSVLIEDTIKIK